MNFVPKERSKKTIERILQNRQKRSEEKAAERRRKILLEKNSE